MALNNNREQYWKIFRRAVVAVFLLIVVMINITEFKRLISSNPQKITEYHLPEDIYAELRNPVLSVTYYTVPEGLPKIVVLPYRYLNGFLQNLKKVFREKQIQNIVVGIQTNQNVAKADLDKNLFENIPLNVFSYQEIQESKVNELISYLKTDGSFLILAEDLDDSDLSGALNMAQKAALNLNLRPMTRNLLRKKTVLPEEKKDFSKPLTIEEQYLNLKTFVKDYQDLLQNFIKAVLSNQPNKIIFSEKTKHFWDKAAVYVLAFQKKENQFQEYGSILFENSVMQGISSGILQARKEMPQAEIRVFLLTGKILKNYADEKDFEKDLQEGDGVLLIDGKRKGLMLPYFWGQYPDKKEFINQLKLKSGISPDYWSEKTDIYYFKAVEIPYHED